MISQTAEYALRAVVCLGTQGDQPVTTQSIAERTQVPAGYLSKVLQGLGRAGLVESRRGLGGGFALARGLEEISILDVVNAVDPLKRITRCPLGLVEHGVQLCPLHRRLDDAIALTESLFEGTKIADLLEDTSGLGRLKGPICPGRHC